LSLQKEIRAVAELVRMVRAEVAPDMADPVMAAQEAEDTAQVARATALLAVMVRAEVRVSEDTRRAEALEREGTALSA
jgi:hypothetical protein